MNYHFAEPSDFPNDPSHVFVNLTPKTQPSYYRYYNLQGTGRHLHVAEAGEAHFEMLMTIGKHLQYIHESEVDFADVAAAFNRGRRRWTLGSLNTGEKAVHCRLPFGHGFMMKF